MSEPPASHELLALIAEEKGALVDPGDARARLAGRLAAELASTEADPSPPRARGVRALSRNALLRAIGIFGAGVAAGIAADRAVSPGPKTEIRYIDRVVEVARDTGAGAAPSTAPSVEVPPGAPSPVPAHAALPSAPVASSALPHPPVLEDPLARERQLIDVARSALARRDAAAALAAIEEHVRRFPHGQLAEMREALAVRALVGAGRGREARVRAVQFQRSFPESVYAPVVDAAISSIP